MLNIFFIAAIRGGRAHQPTCAQINTLLKKFGTVLSDHVSDEKVTEYGETDLSKEAIHEREMKTLEACDVVIAEVTTPSLGVGYLIGQALHAEKRVICLYYGKDTYKLSAMIKGNAQITVFAYTELNEIEQFLERELVSAR